MHLTKSKKPASYEDAVRNLYCPLQGRGRIPSTSPRAPRFRRVTLIFIVHRSVLLYMYALSLYKCLK